jgi:hypothetical protein
MLIVFNGFLYISICMILQNSWMGLLYALGDLGDHTTAAYVTYKISVHIYHIVEGLIWLVVDFTFLAMFIKFSKKISEDESDQI